MKQIQQKINMAKRLWILSASIPTFIANYLPVTSLSVTAWAVLFRESMCRAIFTMVM